MESFSQLFNNREIAIGIWILILILVFVFYKPWRNALKDLLKSCVPILLNKKISVVGILGAVYFLYSIHLLNKLNMWNVGLLKDTILWIITVNIPLFVEVACNNDGNKYFKDLLRDNFKLALVFEFLFNNWSFGILAEFVLLPIMLLISLCFMFSSENKKFKPANNVCVAIILIYTVLVIINGVSLLFDDLSGFFNADTLKAFVLPLMLLILNLPYLYAIALYSKYDVLFLRIKPDAQQKKKMKLLLLLNGKFNLTKVTCISKNLTTTLLISDNPQELKCNLDLLEKRMNYQIGDMYMKRSNFYLSMFIFIIILSALGIMSINFTNSFKDLIQFKFDFDIEQLKKILTYILASSISFSIGGLIYSWGLRKKKYEEITNVKRFAMYDFLLALKCQKEKLECDDILDSPIFMYTNYIASANELLYSTNKLLSNYGNLLTTYEKENIETTNRRVKLFLCGFIDKDGNFYNDDYQSFIDRYNKKYINIEKNKKQNNFIVLGSDLKQYKGMIDSTYEIFKNYY